MFPDPSKLAMNSKAAGSLAEATTRPAVMEPKFDGIRLLLHVRDDDVLAYARSGKSKTGKLPAIEAELLEYLPPNTWIDAEAVAFNPDGTQDWGGAQSVLGSSVEKAASRSGSIRLVIFDILSHGGIDARALPFSNRRQLLEEIFEGADFKLCMLSPQFEPSEDVHAALLESGYEGSMVKHLDAPYRSGVRSPASLKLKAVDTVDAVITGFSPPKPDSWIAAAGLVGTVDFVHYLEDGTEVEGRCSGMTVAERELLTARQSELVDQVIEVSYMTKMPSGKLRHPQFIRLRTDKTKEECRA